MAGRTAAVTVLALLAGAAPAAAQGPIFDDYRADGRIDPCDYSPEELKQGLDSLPPDVLQYAPDLADQLRRGAACAAPAPTTEPEQADAPPAAAAPPPADPPAPPRVPDPPAPDPAPLPRIEGAAPAVAVAPPPDEGEPAWPWLLVGAAGVLGALAWLAPAGGGRRLAAGLRR